MEKIETIEKKINAIETILNGIKDEFAKLKDEPKPEFKVGQWVVFIPDIAKKMGCYTQVWDAPHILRISEIHREILWFNEDQHPYGENIKCSNSCECFRPATSQEIESHLKKIANERYKFGVKFKSIFTDNGDIREVQPYYPNQKHIEWTYFDDEDRLYCESGMKTFDKFCSNPTIYKQGKWCEIIPEKKKLPETKEEFKIFIDDFWHKFPEDSESYGLSLNNFLDEYNFED